MGRGSSDPILNKMMPKKAILNAPNVVLAAQSQLCRDEVERIACVSLQGMIIDLRNQAKNYMICLDDAQRIVAAKIKKYEEEL